MDCEVPLDFDKPWIMSDVVLHTQDSDGKEIYGCKTTDDSPVIVEGDYDAMVEILRNIHQIGYTYYSAPNQYPWGKLVKMYKLADKYDFAFIRKLCVDHIEGFANFEMAKAAAELELDVFMKILIKLDKLEVMTFLKDDEVNCCLNKEEFLMIYEKVVGYPLSKSKDVSPEPSKGLLSLEEITEDLENPRVDLTKPWPTADLAISTNSAKGRLLYANKAVIDMMCPKFAKHLCTSDELLLEGPKMLFARIDVEFTTIREILYIIHVCKTDFNAPDRVFHPALLHSMYCAAGVDQLDIPMIRNLCESQLAQYKSLDALDVLCCLNIDSLMLDMMDSLTSQQLRDWIFREDMHLSYRNGNKTVAITPSQKDYVIYTDLTLYLIDTFRGRRHHW